jgi:DNA repair exonuclease SbcCD ATPase subunit
MNKTVNFNKIVIQNFLSIGNKPVEVDFRSGLHIITGTNRDQSDRRNGVGKSTILDALSFVLFGQTLRELKKEFVINNITKKTSKVVLFFSVTTNNSTVNYELHRTIDPSKCYLYENGVDVTRDSMVNTTNFIQQTLSLTPEVFTNCIAMTVNNMIPFMAKKKIEKRKFIESIFNLEVFSKMNSNLKVELLESKKDLEISCTKLEEIKKIYDTLVLQKENKLKEKTERLATLRVRLEKNDKELKDIETKINSFQKLDLKSVEEKINLAESKVAQLTQSINVVGKEITSLETKRDFTQSSFIKIGTDKDICPICLKQVTDHDKEHIKTTKKGLKEQINVFETEIKTLESKLEVYEESKVKLKAAIAKLKDIINKQNVQLEQQKHLYQKKEDVIEYKKTINKDINDIDKEDNSLNNLLLQQKQSLDTIAQEVDKKQKDIEILDYVKFVLGEDGVRSYIVKKILLVLNNKLAYYLRKLNSNAIIHFDEFFEETITNERGLLTSYYNYSGAEKKVIDLAIMFTFIEMLRLQSNVSYNVQFYDELLDTSLDEAGVEIVVSLLNELISKFNYGIYIVSHRKECSRLSNGDVIFLEKKEGLTKRVKFDQ